MPTIWVVKLGGSLADSDLLPVWLNLLADANVIVVPGGGPFADQVRTAQTRWRFDDRAAHDMALLAMAQYGRMLAGLCPRFCTSADPVELMATLEAGGSAVWLPRPAKLAEAAIPASWEVTSDSLAAWLAGRIGAAHLLLVKSAVSSPAAIPASRLSDNGLVDHAFPSFTTSATFETWLCHRQDYGRLNEGLRKPHGVFTPVIHGN